MRKRTATFAIMALTVGMISLNGAGTAQAADRCKRTSLSFDLPNRPDMSGYAELCVTRINSGTLTASVLVQLEGVPIPASDRFDSFKIGVRLERHDADVATKTKTVTVDINHGRVFTDSISATGHSSAKGGWTADGTIYYNVNNDGKGGLTKGLAGTSQIN